jgi:tetratricopeptide (TPR) repeat protein
MGSTPDRGSLAETPLPHLLLRLHRDRFGGTLHLTRERLAKSFRFQGGLPITVESNRSSESLAQQLVAAGTLTPEDGKRIAGHAKREGCREATALIALKLIDPKGLVQAMKDQVRLRMVECFGWPCGEFRIDGDETPADGAQALQADLYGLLREGIETHWSADRILGDLAPRMGSFPRPNGAFADIESRIATDPGVQVYLAALDGSRPLWKALQRATTPRALAAAWLLDAIGALDYAAEPGVAEPGPADAGPEIEIEVSAQEAPVRPAARAKSEAAASRAAPERAAGAEALEREIQYKFENLARLNHYELLGVATRAKARDLKNAYLAAARTYHPDALARSGVDRQTRERANKVFAAIGTAYGVLSKPRQRAEYDAALRDGEPAVDAERLASAETLYRKGEILMRSGKFKDAVGFLRPAVELWPEEADYQAGLGWSLFKMRPPEKAAARAHLEKAVELDPSRAAFWHRLSLVLGELGEEDAAAQALQRARAIDPKVG